MPLFSKSKVVLWPKAKAVEIYIDKKDSNNLSVDINLWEDHTEKELEPLLFFLKQNKIDACSILIPDDVVLTKSFIYDTKITEIDQKEVIGLAESFVHFKIEPGTIEYSLTQETDKTIIRAQIFEKKKIDALKSNLAKLNISITSIRSVSTSIAQVLSGVNTGEFFLIYPLNEHEYTLILSKNNLVYLTANVKGPSLDIQKIINYSNLYFSTPAKKLYVPESKEIEILTTSKLEQTPYSESQISQSRGKAANLPLPVLGELSSSNQANAVIIEAPVEKSTDISLPLSPKPMEHKKNILPIVAVFIFTAALASVIIWFVLNKNNAEIQNPSSQNQTAENAAPTDIPTPTVAPAPTVAVVEPSKTIKIQVLNATDINGQAATIKAKFTQLGFKSVAVGNTKEKATENTIQMKSKLATSQGYFETNLASDFPSTYTTDLKDSSSFDMVVTIGTDLSQSGLGSATTTTVTPAAAKSATVTPKAATKSATTTPGL